VRIDRVKESVPVAKQLSSSAVMPDTSADISADTSQETIS